MSFKSFQLHQLIESGVRELGYTIPTPIQRQAIPEILKGGDVMGLAQTGTGKTAAFVLPMLQRFIDKPQGNLRALIIAPTRELAEQIHQAIRALGRKTRLKSVAIYGGVSLNPQIKILRDGVDIVVACPGRLLDHIGQRNLNLSGIEFLVMDEADRMLDMGFMPDVRKILKHLPQKRQTLMFSATMPDDIAQLAREVLKNPVTIEIDHLIPINTVTHALYPVEQHLKTALLMELLRRTDTESVLIFTRTKHRAKRLAQQLERANYRSACLQGNLSQNRRQEALDGFRNGSYQILVATDIAARGLDVSTISHVINYDIPDTADAYTHRIGRTGRAAKTGDAFTLVTRDDSSMVADIERVLKTKLERRRIEGFDYHAPAPARNEEFARPPRDTHRSRPAPSALSRSGKQPQAASQPAPKTDARRPMARKPEGATAPQAAHRSEGKRPRRDRFNPARTTDAASQPAAEAAHRSEEKRPRHDRFNPARTTGAASQAGTSSEPKPAQERPRHTFAGSSSKPKAVPRFLMKSDPRTPLAHKTMTDIEPEPAPKTENLAPPPPPLPVRPPESYMQSPFKAWESLHSNPPPF